MLVELLDALDAGASAPRRRAGAGRAALLGGRRLRARSRALRACGRECPEGRRGVRRPGARGARLPRVRRRRHGPRRRARATGGARRCRRADDRADDAASAGRSWRSSTRDGGARGLRALTRRAGNGGRLLRRDPLGHLRARAASRRDRARSSAASSAAPPPTSPPGLARLGVRSAVVGGVGRDRFGDALRTSRRTAWTRASSGRCRTAPASRSSRATRAASQFLFYRHDSADVAVRAEHVTRRWARALGARRHEHADDAGARAATPRFLEAAERGARRSSSTSTCARTSGRTSARCARGGGARRGARRSSRRATPTSRRSASARAACAGSSDTRRRRRGSSPRGRSGERGRRARRGRRPPRCARAASTRRARATRSSPGRSRCSSQRGARRGPRPGATRVLDGAPCASAT